jgi:hypothetical protein
MEAGVYANEGAAMVPGMGCDFNDYNNDGLPDIFYADLVGETFTLFTNIGDRLFRDDTLPSRLGLLSAQHSGWSVKFANLDNDGWKDVFVAGSHVVDNVQLMKPGMRYKESCRLFRNLGNGKFEDPTTQLGEDFQVAAANRGMALAALDNDGSLEVTVSRLNDTALLFKKGAGRPGTACCFNFREPGVTAMRSAPGL